MVSGKQLFAPMPLRAMAADLSGLQLRVLACVAAHDRLSLVKGKGQGCRASNERMSHMIGCNYSNLCTALSELVDLDYLQREKLGRHTVYRVIYTDDDRLLFGNVSERAIGCPAASEHAPIGCPDDPSNAGNQPETSSQYIPLNGGIDSDESGEEISSEEARFAARDALQWAKGPSVGAQLAMMERALKNDPGSVEPLPTIAWLEALDSGSVAECQRAMRLHEQLVEALDEDTYAQWADGIRAAVGGGAVGS